MSLLSLKGVTKYYDRRGQGLHCVLDHISLEVDEGHFVTILGQSGVGKTTLLNIIAGLELPSSGEVTLQGERVRSSVRKNILRSRSTCDSPVSFVFQQPALLPWRTVVDNVALPLELGGVAQEERTGRAINALASVGLKDVATSFPHTLSGGMRSRVAIARAMVQNPRLLLMDEPFASLDPIMRETFDINLMRFCSNRNVTGIFVTHSVTEACLLAHKVLIMDGGRFVDTIKVDVPWPRTREVLADENFLHAVKSVRQSLLKTSMADLMPRPRYLKEKNVFVDAFEVRDEEVENHET